MKVAVLGAGGVVGQSMILNKPDDIDAVFTRTSELEPLYLALDANDIVAATELLDKFKPDVIINLIGENNVDVVQQDPKSYEWINARFPALLSSWCERSGSYLIQVSTQGVFSGEDPPYEPSDKPDPLTSYGKQKAEAEEWVISSGFTVARLTFVLGVRPFKGIGRENPIEQIIRMSEQSQVNDRLFSPVFAADAAQQLWNLARQAPTLHSVYHIGIPNRYSRYDIASEVAWAMQMSALVTPTIHKVSHNHFQGIAPRPKDTTWSYGSLFSTRVEDGVLDALTDYKRREDMDLNTRSREIATFLNEDEDEVRIRLAQGFSYNHELVAKDFKDAGTDVNDPDSLLNWYRTTTAYIYELTAYHLDEGFGYMNMAWGIATHLAGKGVRNVLTIGDGIGDLTLELAKNPQLNGIYNDLLGSKTAEFAKFRFNLNTDRKIGKMLTDGWTPVLGSGYEAVVAMDFFEHLVNVEDWVRAVYDALDPGGIFLAENSFGVGDAEHGDSIPMHLSENNKYITEWDALLESVGFEPTGEGTWWRKT